MRRVALCGLALSALLAGGAAYSQQQPSTVPPAPSRPLGPVATQPLPLPPPEEAPAAVVTPPPSVAAEPAAVAPSPPEKPVEVKPAAPLKRARANVAILQALDKVTAETMRFEAPVGQAIRYKTLIFTVRACEISAADEPVRDAAAYVQVQSQQRGSDGKPAGPLRQAFRGWMFASSPGVSPFEHPVYDAWLIACKTSSAPAPAAKR